MLYPDFDELVQWGGGRGARLDLVSNRRVLATAAGDYASPFRGQGLTFHEVREYRPGDDVRNIDWRVTARVNKPHMKVFTEERERTVLLCVDANAAMRFGTRGTFKSVQAARVAALLGWLAHGGALAQGGQDRVGCLLFGDVPDGVQLFKPARSRRPLWRALKLLSDHTTGAHPTEMPLTTAMHQLDRVAPTGALVFIISDFHAVTETLEQNLVALQRRCDTVLIRIEDPADGTIPPMGMVSFSDMTGNLVTVDTDSRQGQAAYAAQWQAQRNRLEDICARTGIGLIALQTGGSVRDDLLAGLRRFILSRRR